MSDIKHLVFSPDFQGLRTSFHVKEAGADALLFEGIPVGFWLNSLDVFHGAVTEGRKAFTIKPYRYWWSSHHVSVSDNEVLGTVMQESVFSHDWVIMDASTGIVGNICRTVAHKNNFFGGECQIKIDESVVCTLKLKRTWFYGYRADLYYLPEVTARINGALLISASLLVMAAWNMSG